MMGSFARIAAASLLVSPAFAAVAADMYTPSLPARGDEYLECRILNVSASPQTVTTESRMSTGAVAGGPYTQTLAPGESGGFSIPGWNGGMYCHFTVAGSTKSFRTSIDTLAVDAVGTYIKVALPGD